MLRIACKKLIPANRILIPTSNNSTTISTSVFFCSVTTLDSTKSTQGPKDANFKVSYLVESCGLAPEAAKCLQLGFSDNPEASRLADRSKAVIKIFKHYGFHDYHIARLVLKKPQFLSSDPDKELSPKVKLLASLGAHPSSAAEILLNFPSQHLQDRFVPFVDFLTSVHLTGEEVIEMMVSFCHKAGFDPQSFLVNMASLRKVGMPNSIISHFIRTDYCHIKEKFMLFESSGLFEKIVDEVKAMGLNPKRCVFVDAILAVSTIGIATYKRKSKVFKKWGWSDPELLKAFIEQPQFLDHKEKKIDEVMDCLVKTLGFKPSIVLQCPLAFTCSTKKLISRFSVAKFLWQKGVIDVDRYKMSSVLETNEHLFMERFVIKHMEIVPELFDLYSQCKTDGKPFYAWSGIPLESLSMVYFRQLKPDQSLCHVAITTQLCLTNLKQLERAFADRYCGYSCCFISWEVEILDKW